MAKILLPIANFSFGGYWQRRSITARWECAVKIAAVLAPGLLASIAPVNAAAETSGYAQPVTDAGQQARAQALLEKSAAAIGLPPKFVGCRQFEQVAVGVRNSETAYGAVCRIAFPNYQPREFAVCTGDISGGFDLYDGAIVGSAEWMTQFIRHNCF